MITLSPEQEKIFRAFQSNLISLISHELRTPLTSISNAVSLLEEGDYVKNPEFSELLSIAKRNVKRLQNSLASILDIAELESGAFHARLKEVDFVRAVRLSLEATQAILSDRSITVEIRERLEMNEPCLADPQKLSRAIEMVVNIVSLWAEAGKKLQVELQPYQSTFEFELERSSFPLWENYWSQALIGFQSGVMSPSSAFAGTVQSERDFLTRTKEGLGSDLLLIHQIQNIHQGSFEMSLTGMKVKLILKIPRLDQEQQLESILASRIFEHSSGIGVVTLFRFEKPESISTESIKVKLAELLSKETDAVYLLERTREVFVLSDDLKKEAVLDFSQKIKEVLEDNLEVRFVTAPDDGVDAVQLIAMLRIGK